MNGQRRRRSTTSGLLYDASLAGARDYLALLESGERVPHGADGLSSPGAAARPRRWPPLEPRSDFAPAGAQPGTTGGGRRRSDVAGARRAAASAEHGSLWHRIPLGDEAELVISDRVYGRHRDRVDWLVRWARKVFG